MKNIWPQFKLSDVGSFSKGAGISKEQLSETGLNAVRYGELYTRFNFKIDKIYSHISDDIVPLTKKIKYGDILFAGSGETIDEIGKSAAYLLKEDCYAGGDIIIFTPKGADSLFMAYYLNVGEGRMKLRELGQGQSVVHIYKSDIENLKLHLPPLSEQKRIAKVLEIWDDAIEKLGWKIEIKKHIKKGLMQKLLTGKVRLPGFSEKWETKKFSDFMQEVDERVENKIIEPVAVGVYGIRKRSSIFSKKLSDNYSNNKILKKNELCFGIGTRAIVSDTLLENSIYCVSPAYKIFKINDNNPYFINKFIDINRKKISAFFMIVSARQGKSVDFNGLMSYKFNLPNIKEQDAIAEVLTKSDNEIELLQDKLNKFKDQKKYLLNNLITGEIRTPEGI